MRSIGTHRGNPLLRASVAQGARRRMEWLPVPQQAGGARRGAEPAPFTRSFYDRVRDGLLPRMVPALSVDGAELRYFASERLALWGLRAPQGLVLAYECAEAPAQLAEHARRWMSCLRTRTVPGMLGRTWGRPVYGARHEAAWDLVDVVWATPGEWCEFVLGELPRAAHRSLPPHWDESETARS